MYDLSLWRYQILNTRLQQLLYAKNDPNLTFFRTHLHERGSKIVAKYGLFCGSKIVFNEGWWVFAVYMRYGRRAVAPEGAVP